MEVDDLEDTQSSVDLPRTPGHPKERQNVERLAEMESVRLSCTGADDVLKTK